MKYAVCSPVHRCELRMARRRIPAQGIEKALFPKRFARVESVKP
jgi:hypothetical protein